MLNTQEMLNIINIFVMSQRIQSVSCKQFLPKWAYNQQWLLIVNLEEGEIKAIHDMVNLYIHPII